jgi:hypothetical protein
MTKPDIGPDIAPPGHCARVSLKAAMTDRPRPWLDPTSCFFFFVAFFFAFFFFVTVNPKP